MDILTCINCGSLFNGDYIDEYRKKESDCTTYSEQFKSFFICPVCKQESEVIVTVEGID